VTCSANKGDLDCRIGLQDKGILVESELRAWERDESGKVDQWKVCRSLVREAISEYVEECRDRGRLILNVVDNLNRDS